MSRGTNDLLRVAASRRAEGRDMGEAARSRDSKFIPDDPVGVFADILVALAKEILGAFFDFLSSPCEKLESVHDYTIGDVASSDALISAGRS